MLITALVMILRRESTNEFVTQQQFCIVQQRGWKNGQDARRLLCPC
jgi:hypothetical protein